MPLHHAPKSSENENPVNYFKKPWNYLANPLIVRAIHIRVRHTKKSHNVLAHHTHLKKKKKNFQKSKLSPKLSESVWLTLIRLEHCIITLIIIGDIIFGVFQHPKNFSFDNFFSFDIILC